MRGPVTAMAVTPDGRFAVSGSADATLRVWELATGRPQATLPGHTGPVTTVAVTPDGRFAVSGSADAILRVWDLTTDERSATLPAHMSPVKAVAVTPNGRFAVSVGSTDNQPPFEPFEQYGQAVRRTDCANEPPAMAETYPLRAKAIGRSWALELALGITGIGLKVLCRIPFYAARSAAFPLARHSPVRHRKVLLL
jgi:hypothetical protein